MTAVPSPPGETSARNHHTTGPAFDVIILAGGRARRLGTAKPGAVVGGQTLLDHALAATQGARRVVVVGPPELTGDYLLTQEDPPFGGPVAGIAAGLAALVDDAARLGRRTTHPGAGSAGQQCAHPGAGWVLVLACDVPLAGAMVRRLRATLAAALAAAPTGTPPASTPPASTQPATALPVQAVYPASGGREQWLVGLYDAAALQAAVTALPHGPHGASIRALMAGLEAIVVPDDEDLTFDIDTWQDASVHEQRVTALRTKGVAMTNIENWVAALTQEFDLDSRDVDVTAVLKLAADAAHSVERPAAPLTTYVAGLVAGRKGTDPAAVMARVTELALAWSPEPTSNEPQA